MNVVKEIERINKREIENGIYGGVTKVNMLIIYIKKM